MNCSLGVTDALSFRGVTEPEVLQGESMYSLQITRAQHQMS